MACGVAKANTPDSSVVPKRTGAASFARRARKSPRKCDHIFMRQQPSPRNSAMQVHGLQYPVQPDGALEWLLIDGYRAPIGKVSQMRTTRTDTLSRKRPGSPGPRAQNVKSGRNTRP
jgi:hypothetical protein